MYLIDKLFREPLESQDVTDGSILIPEFGGRISDQSRSSKIPQSRHLLTLVSDGVILYLLSSLRKTAVNGVGTSGRVIHSNILKFSTDDSRLHVKSNIVGVSRANYFDTAQNFWERPNDVDRHRH